jgi:DNA-binding transcriptional MerR regulator
VSVKRDSFSRQQAAEISGLSSRQLAYWRTTGLVVPQHRTRGGHARYSFLDLIALRTARRLLDAGVSLQRIRKCLQSLVRFLPTIEHPLADLSLVVTGDVVLVFRGTQAFDALTGQQWVFPVAELAREVEQLQRQRPQQGELFPAGHRHKEVSA